MTPLKPVHHRPVSLSRAKFNTSYTFNQFLRDKPEVTRRDCNQSEYLSRFSSSSRSSCSKITIFLCVLTSKCNPSILSLWMKSLWWSTCSYLRHSPSSCCEDSPPNQVPSTLWALLILYFSFFIRNLWLWRQKWNQLHLFCFCSTENTTIPLQKLPWVFKKFQNTVQQLKKFLYLWFSH